MGRGAEPEEERGEQRRPAGGLGDLWSRTVLTEASEALVDALELVLTRLEEERDTPSRGAEPRSGSEEVWLRRRGRRGADWLAPPSSSMCSSRLADGDTTRWEGLEKEGGARRPTGEEEEEEEQRGGGR